MAVEPSPAKKVDGRRAAGAETRRRLLEAAADLLAERGEPGVTLRAVSTAAAANVAAVQYHFGSREQLIAAVVSEAAGHVAEAQVAAFDALDAGGASPEDWVTAWAGPLIDVATSTSAPQRRLGRIVGHTLAMPLSALDVQVRELASGPTERLIDALERALPQVGRPELTLRVALMSSALAGLASGAFEPWLERSEPARDLRARLLARLVRVASGDQRLTTSERRVARR